MKPEIAELWATALESGEYKKYKGQLTHVAADGSKAHCCLGVLTELAIKAGISVVVSAPDHNGRVRYNDRGDFPPIAVCEWAGLKDERGLYDPGTNKAHPSTLADDNDSEESTFETIARTIRANVEAL